MRDALVLTTSLMGSAAAIETKGRRKLCFASWVHAQWYVVGKASISKNEEL